MPSGTGGLAAWRLRVAAEPRLPAETKGAMKSSVTTAVRPWRQMTCGAGRRSIRIRRRDIDQLSLMNSQAIQYPSDLSMLHLLARSIGDEHPAMAQTNVSLWTVHSGDTPTYKYSVDHRSGYGK